LAKKVKVPEMRPCETEMRPRETEMRPCETEMRPRETEMRPCETEMRPCETEMRPRPSPPAVPSRLQRASPLPADPAFLTTRPGRPPPLQVAAAGEAVLMIFKSQ